VDRQRASVEVGENEVGKRAANIDADDLQGLRTPNVETVMFCQPTYNNATSVIGAGASRAA
jgi:hypothetical protein